MPRLQPLALEDLSAPTREALTAAEDLMGFVANDALAMARHPALLDAFGGLVRSLYAPSAVPERLKRLVGYMTSSAAGCQYCQAHTGHSALSQGIDAQTLNAIWDYEASDHFTAAERAALRIAQFGAQSPSGVDDAMYAEFAEHFDAAQQTEVIGIVSLFGFLNRWNAISATDIEAVPGASVAVLSSPERPQDG